MRWAVSWQHSLKSTLPTADKQTHIHTSSWKYSLHAGGVTEVGPITAFSIPIRKSLSQSLLSGCVRPPTPTPVHTQLLTTGGNYRGRPTWEYTFQILADFTFPVLKFYMHFCVHSLTDYSTGALIKYSCSMGAYWLFEFSIKLTTRSLSY